MPDARKVIRRACSDRELRAVLLEAQAAGAVFKRTKSGFLIKGVTGTTSVHTSKPSDWRTLRNIRAELRRIGLDRKD